MGCGAGMLDSTAGAVTVAAAVLATVSAQTRRRSKGGVDHGRIVSKSADLARRGDEAAIVHA
jgi:hypothetical protein